jgi:chaperone LolA
VPLKRTIAGRLLYALTLVALSSGRAGSAAAQTPPSADSLAARIQARYDTVRDFTADFTQRLSGGLVLAGKTAVDRGKVAIRKPGFMRWVLETGDRSEITANGVQMVFYSPEDKVATFKPLPKDDTAPSALLLLSGRGKITRDFTAALPADQPAAQWRLVLTPKAKQSDFKTIALIVDRTTLQLRGLEVTDSQDAVQTFTFSNLKENQGIKDEVFQIKVPKGVAIR